MQALTAGRLATLWASSHQLSRFLVDLLILLYSRGVYGDHFGDLNHEPSNKSDVRIFGESLSGSLTKCSNEPQYLAISVVSAKEFRVPDIILGELIEVAITGDSDEPLGNVELGVTFSNGETIQLTTSEEGKLKFARAAAGEVKIELLPGETETEGESEAGDEDLDKEDETGEEGEEKAEDGEATESGEEPKEAGEGDREESEPEGESGEEEDAEDEKETE